MNLAYWLHQRHLVITTRTRLYLLSWNLDASQIRGNQEAFLESEVPLKVMRRSPPFWQLGQLLSLFRQLQRELPEQPLSLLIYSHWPFQIENMWKYWKRMSSVTTRWLALRLSAANYEYGCYLPHGWNKRVFSQKKRMGPTNTPSLRYSCNPLIYLDLKNNNSSSEHVNYMNYERFNQWFLFIICLNTKRSVQINQRRQNSSYMNMDRRMLCSMTLHTGVPSTSAVDFST